MKSRVAAFVVLVVLILVHAHGQKQAEPARLKKLSLDEVMEQLRLYPGDSYLQYVAMILARQEGKADEVANEIERRMARNGLWPEADFGGPGGRRQQVDLFSIFTGALAVQESLQLDTLRGPRRPGPRTPQMKSMERMKPALDKGQDKGFSKPSAPKDKVNAPPAGTRKDGFQPSPEQRQEFQKKQKEFKDKYDKAKTKEEKKKLVREQLDKVPEAYRDRVKQSLKDQGFEVDDDQGSPLKDLPKDRVTPSPDKKPAFKSAQTDKAPISKDKGPPVNFQDKGKTPVSKDRGVAKPKFEDPQERLKRRRLELVSVSDLKGPSIKSHPWEKMLGDKKPEISPLAQYVPEDFYFVEFRSLTKLLEVMDTSDLWGTHLFNQAVREARTQKIGERVKNQLALETTPLLRPFYDLVVQEVAVTGSDLFVREGSDVTVLFRFRQPEVFRSRMESFLTNAEKKHRGVEKTTGKYLDVEYVHLETPDRDLCVFSAYPAPDLHVRSNSKIALERLLGAIKGKIDKSVRRLGDTTEFSYIRTLMPRGAKEEDGFVYLSDPFIRRLVGPELKLTERRRMICYNHQRMIGHAALLYRTEHGRRADSLDELVKAGCCPGPFNAGDLYCPEGGTYTLSSDGMAGVCSRHGHAHFLTPCCEMPVEKVTGEEADEYQAFVSDYNQYWRTFFDPIALRIQITPQRYRLETIVLPLIDNSIYIGLATVLGDKPEDLESLPIPQRNIFSVAFRINKSRLLQEAGLEEAKPIAEEDALRKRAVVTAADLAPVNNLKMIGLALHNYHDTYGRFPAAAILDKQTKKKPLLSWRVGLLPFVEESNLYQQFHLDEPWDSEHNKRLIARMPKVFRGANAELNKAGKTTVLAPIGEATIFPPSMQRITFASITDGSSNTIMVVDAAPDRAAIWTKPDDWKYDPKDPLAGLKTADHAPIPVVMADGSVHLLRDSIAKEKLQALLTRNGGEPLTPKAADEVAAPPPVIGSPEMRFLEGIGTESVQRFLSKGIGNQAALHVYDASPMFDFNLPGFLGMAMGSFRPQMMRGGFFEFAPLFLIASLNAPVYLSIPIQDEKIVDEFLDRLDGAATVLARHQEGGFIPLSYDFYKFHAKQKPAAVFRSFGFRFGPAKLRFFWARIGGGLYVASKAFILEDLLEMEKAHSQGPVAHAMVRIRAQNWKQVLPDFQLGWAENNREACLANLGPLSSVAWAFTASKEQLDNKDLAPLSGKIHELADRLHTTHFFCPEGGEYVLSADGKTMTCKVHASSKAPRQPPAPLGKSSLGDLLDRFAGMTASLTFLEDGLHAVVTIDRK